MVLSTLLQRTLLFAKAAEGSDFAPLTENLEGPTALLLCFDNKDVEPASEVKKISKENEKVVFKGAYLDGAVLDADQAKSVAGLPSKDVILSQIAGLLVNIHLLLLIFLMSFLRKMRIKLSLLKNLSLQTKKLKMLRAEVKLKLRQKKLKRMIKLKTLMLLQTNLQLNCD